MTGAPGVFGALRDPGFRRLTIAWTVTCFADSMLILTLAIWVKDLTGSSSAAGLVLAAFGLPALAAPLTGHLVDRVSRRRLVAAANLLSVAVVASLLAVRSADQVWLVYLVAAGYAAIGYTTSAAQSGLLKDLLPEQSLAVGNGLLSTIDQGLRLVSPLAGAGLYAVFGAHTVVAATAAALIAGSAVIITVAVRETPPTVATDRDRFHREVAAGLRHLRHTPPLGRITTIMAVAIGATGITNTTLFASIEHGLHRGPQFLGVLASIQGCGAILGGLSAAAVIRRCDERATIAGGLTLLALGVATSATNSLTVMCAGIAAAGIGIVWAVVAAVTLRQRLTPPTLQGRVAAATGMATNLPQTAATLAAAALIIVTDYRVMITAAVLAILAAALTARLPARTASTPRSDANDEHRYSSDRHAGADSTAATSNRSLQ